MSVALRAPLPCYSPARWGRRTRVGKVRAVAAPQKTRAPREENVAGEFFVDRTCIDCDTCRWMAPSSFFRVGGQSAVFRQPSSPHERILALQALLSCPTASIHTISRNPDIRAVHNTFPLHVDPALPGVYHCGFHSEKSYGAASYFVQTPRGNVLVDCPRYTPVLVSRLAALGGVDLIFLSHRDDVADHDRWAARFKCPRVIHEAEVNSGTAAVEVKLKGEGPWALPLQAAPEAQASSGGGSPLEEEEFQIVFTPGHTEGSCSLLLRPGPGREGVLFSGDHLAADEETGELSVDEEHNWFRLDVQRESARKLRDLPFSWVLPGHGRRFKFRDEEHKMEEFSKF